MLQAVAQHRTVCVGACPLLCGVQVDLGMKGVPRI